MKHFSSFENFRPKRIEVRKAFMENKRKDLLSMVEKEYFLENIELFELVPKKDISYLKMNFMSKFLDHLEKNDLIISFEDDELVILDKFEKTQGTDTLYVFVGQMNALYKIQTEKYGARFALLKPDSLVIFKEDTSLQKLADTLIFFGDSV